MAKKRKAGSRGQETAAETELDPRDSRKRIKTYEDVADSDDEFHLNNDKIRLGEDPDTRRRRQRAEKEQFLQQSDEEILGYSEDEEDASDGEREDGSADHKSRHRGETSDEDESRDIDEAEDELGWGTSKADVYGADTIETEEQALEEEAEALRLQKKQLESMQAADYGFDEDDWQKGTTEAETNQKSDDAVVTEILPQLQIDSDLGPAGRLKLLKSRYPEFELLSKDLLDLSQVQSDLVASAELSLVDRTKFRALSAYIGALAMYFSLFTSTVVRNEKTALAMSASQLRDHPIMDSLVKCRQLWTSVEKLTDLAPLALEAADRMDGIETGEQSDLESGSHSPVMETHPVKKSRAERFAEAELAAREQRRAERVRQTEAGLADLDRLLLTGSNYKDVQAQNANAATRGDDSDFGEEASLTAREAEDKAKRKKSLRFYTSQIAQKANKRGAAGRNAGGDDDIPHRERLRDRQARLNAEAEKRGKRGTDIGDDLGGESDEEDGRQAQEIRADAEEDDYYDLVAARASKKKSDRVALAEVQREAALQNGRVIQEEAVGADGKRKISYAIEKNKGLTPHRKKDVRNPRVKKKLKFEQKKKKLASMKAVYKGGEGRGGYGGELTGIKKGLVRSTKL